MSLRFGLVGCGAIHKTHCDALQNVEGGHLAAVYDIEPERAATASEKYGVPAFENFEEFSANVDVVDICVPSGTHAEVGIAAAKLGKHVIVEKPIDTTYEKALALVEACERLGVKLACISQHRFSNQVRRLREAALGGEIGTLLAGDAYIKWHRTQEYYDSGDWRGTWEQDGGGCLINQGVHYIDMLQWIMGGVKSVQAICRTVAHKIEVEDIANVLVEFRNGAIGVIQGSTCFYPGFAERLEIHGKYGSVVLEGDRTRVWKVEPEKVNLGKYGAGVMSQPTPNLQTYQLDPYVTDDLTATWGEQHRLQLQDFVLAVSEDRDPFLTGRMALEPLKIILAVYQSSQNQGTKVHLS